MIKLFEIAFALFLLMDAIGNIPLYITFLKEIEPKKQRKIILRELFIAFVVIILFNFIGEGLLVFLNISKETVQVSGGIILFILALRMIFPEMSNHIAQDLLEVKEPFIVPLAIPLVAGPAVLTAVMLYSKQIENNLLMTGSIFIAWFFSLIILILAPTFSKLLGKRGIVAIQRLMGLILVMISIEMFLSGIQTFVHQL